MARGRPSIPHNPTKFMNSKKRVIFMTAEGKYVAKSEDGKKVYGPRLTTSRAQAVPCVT